MTEKKGCNQLVLVAVFLVCVYGERMYLLSVKLKDEARALGIGRVDGEVALHLECHLLTDREAETVACGEVANATEGFEDFFAVVNAFFCARDGDATACVGDDELVGVGTALLIVERDTTAFWGVEDGIAEQMGEDVGDILTVEVG